MNNVIKDIIKTVGTDTSGKWIGVDNAEKLAELIVRECIEVVKWTPSVFYNDECVKNMREHFGIK